MREYMLDRANPQPRLGWAHGATGKAAKSLAWSVVSPGKRCVARPFVGPSHSFAAEQQDGPIGIKRTVAPPELHKPRAAENWAPAVLGEGLLRAFAEQHDADSLDQHQQVEEQGVVLDVVQVELVLPARVFDRCTVAVAHLRPTGDAGLHAVR